jgi:hypothetical protein
MPPLPQVAFQQAVTTMGRMEKICVVTVKRNFQPNFPGQMLKFVKKTTMEVIQMRQKLHEFIDSMEDKKAAAIYTLLENELDTGSYRKQLVLQERQAYLAGEGTSHSWEEVKQMAMHKEKRNGL